MSKLIEKLKSPHWRQVAFIILMALVVVGTDSCKSSGKMSKKQRKAEIEAAKQKLQPIINGTSTLSYDEQKRVVQEVMDKNLNDPVLNSMIVEAQQKLKSLLTEQTKAHNQKVDEARAKLFDILLNKENKSADELEKELNAIKAMRLGETEIDELIGRCEKKIAEMRSGGAASNLPVRAQLENAFNEIVAAAHFPTASPFPVGLVWP